MKNSTQIIKETKALLKEERDIWDVLNEQGLEGMIRSLGYYGFDDFFDDNQGAREAVVDWIARMISENQVPEWGEKLGIQADM